jgi:hypothetical protein
VHTPIHLYPLLKVNENLNSYTDGYRGFQIGLEIKKKRQNLEVKYLQNALNIKASDSKFVQIDINNPSRFLYEVLELNERK